MKINAGALDRRIEIMAPDRVQDELGQLVDTYEPMATVWGQRLEMRTQDAARAGGKDTFATSRYLIRYIDGLRTSQRISVGGVLHDIVAIDQPDRRATLILTVTEVTR